VVHWDVEVTNQDDEAVAVYTILTLVRQRRDGATGLSSESVSG
jgi:acyl dehydratase